ncbi:peptidylprolyl isomerase [Halothiobacillus sp. DCM-1]|uniref:FKBP-type peptidyl-prolyl cis-trans isomerase n=1 Tax=Halothiobacillus sp. DCM-1 TaxID=3112558 RepID=UPI00324883F4
MKVAQNKVVRLDYTLRDDDGEVLDSTANRVFEYLHGYGNLIPALEAALEGKAEGERFSVVIEPEDAYGLHDPEAVVTVPRARFAPEVQVVPGNMVETQGPEGRIELLILAVDGDQVTVDLNHPLAGLRLHFEGTVVDLRDGHPDEIKHRRVHPGGHHLMVQDSTFLGDWHDEPDTEAGARG